MTTENRSKLYWACRVLVAAEDINGPNPDWAKHVEELRAALQGEPSAPPVQEHCPRCSADPAMSTCGMCGWTWDAPPSASGGAALLWRPIVSAPHHQTVWVKWHGEIVAAYFDMGHWHGPRPDDFTYSGPTHWMPKPKADIFAADRSTDGR